MPYWNSLADDLSIFKILLSLLNWIFITDRLCTRDANLNISSLFVHVYIVFAYMQIVYEFSPIFLKSVHVSHGCMSNWLRTYVTIHLQHRQRAADDLIILLLHQYNALCVNDALHYWIADNLYNYLIIYDAHLPRLQVLIGLHNNLSKLKLNYNRLNIAIFVHSDIYIERLDWMCVM